MPRAMPGALALLSITLTAACGGGAAPKAEADSAAAGTSASVGSGFDPCTLLTSEEVEAAMGWAVAKTTPYANGDRGHCVYESARGNTVLPPEQVDAGVIPCWTNFPCQSDAPDQFASSAALVSYRLKLYQGGSMPLDPAITPIDGLGAPALMHELATQYTMEAWLGHQKLAYVSVWDSESAARSLGEKVLARTR